MRTRRGEGGRGVERSNGGKWMDMGRGEGMQRRTRGEWSAGGVGWRG